MTRTPVSNEDIINETRDCVAFKRRRGFIERIDPETDDFPLAYNILAHTNANQLVQSSLGQYLIIVCITDYKTDLSDFFCLSYQQKSLFVIILAYDNKKDAAKQKLN